MTPEGFLDAARSIVGAAHVLTDPAETAGYTVDWTRRFAAPGGACVIRPADAGEVAGLVLVATQHGVALVPQGGNTGLVGGGVPLAGEAVLSLRRLDRIDPVDRVAGQVTAGAGATLAQVQAAAGRAGWDFGVDLAARDSATIGGMVATNAGGVHVVRHGTMRSQVIGVEAVLGSGAVVARLGGLVKDNTGYDLAQLLCGSEGTLGIVTRVRLRLVPPPGELAVALLGLRSMGDAVALAGGLRATAPGVRALEGMAGDSLRLVAGHLGVPPPTAPGAGAFLLVEMSGPGDPTSGLIDAVTAISSAATGGIEVLDAVVASSHPDRERLWRVREAHAEAAAKLAAEAGGVVHKLDVTLPAAVLGAFCEEVAEAVAVAWPGATTLLYGHVGDGNLHVNVVPPLAAPPAEGAEVDDVVLGLVVERGGSISAEHGIGTAKKRWLLRDRSPAEVAAMRAVKRALDPAGILNPNVLLP